MRMQVLRVSMLNAWF